jgi:4-amino-4-deoxy-L-arabinose transferase-like glycosyltransferase
MPSRAASSLIIVVLWATLYLPMLGSLELRGEEGKRVMPAVQMLESGNYLVPYLGAHPYLNKPPMTNWLVAASFRTFGIRNEWPARLLSAVFVLLGALTLVTIGRPDLSAAGSMMPAGEPLFAIDLRYYESYLFYVRAQLRYLSRLEELPANARFFNSISRSG